MNRYSYTFCILLGLTGVLSAPAQQHLTDTTVLGPKESAALIDSILAQKAHKDSVAIAEADPGPDPTVDSASLEHAAGKAGRMTARSIPDSVIASRKKDKDFAYANDPSYWREEATDAPADSRFLRLLGRLLSSNGFRYFIYILLGGVLLYVIIRIIVANNFFYHRPAKTAALPGEASDPLEEDLDQLLQQALAAKDNRLAVRYFYLKALRSLNERELIRYNIQSTNREYVNQLNGSAFGAPFRFLTGAYERIWYGDLVPGEGQFERLHQYFQDFYKSIGQS